MPANLIQSAIDKLRVQLNSINVDGLLISEYNKQYLNKYKNNFNFYMHNYAQLLEKTIAQLDKPIHESVFVDYGGGCGILSFLAINCGFKQVVYNDIYHESVQDVQEIAKAINCDMNHFIAGDIDQLFIELEQQNVRPSCICSFDVLEHIYNVNAWINSIAEYPLKLSVIAMTSANPENPFINTRLKKLHQQAELIGFEKNKSWKPSDLNTSFLNERKKIIAKHFPAVKKTQLQQLAAQTRGLREEDIISAVQEYIDNGKLSYQIIHPSNTCDPYTGNWTERLLNLEKLKQYIRSKNLQVSIHNSFYACSTNKLLNIPKFVLNFLLKIAGNQSLLLSPTYTLIIKKRRNNN